jgi:hypothetical protein
MSDPGLTYLYSKSPQRTPSSGGSRLQHRSGSKGPEPTQASLSSLTPQRDRSQQDLHNQHSNTPEAGHLTANGQLGRWEAALGNIDDARLATDMLSRAVDDAVYLDEDAYHQVQPKVAYLKTIQAQQGRIATLTMEQQELQKHLAAAENVRRRSDQQVKEVQSELENNSAVFRLHYNEILAKNEEIKRLQAVIEGLSSGR